MILLFSDHVEEIPLLYVCIYHHLAFSYQFEWKLVFWLFFLVLALNLHMNGLWSDLRNMLDITIKSIWFCIIWPGKLSGVLHMYSCRGGSSKEILHSTRFCSLQNCTRWSSLSFLVPKSKLSTMLSCLPFLLALKLSINIVISLDLVSLISEFNWS